MNSCRSIEFAAWAPPLIRPTGRPPARMRPCRGARRPRRWGCPASRGSGGPGRGRCDSFGGLLGEVEVTVLLRERKRTPILARRGSELLGNFYAFAETLRRAP